MMTELIAEGDDIFLYLDRRRTYLVKVEADKSFHTHKGYIQLGDLIGKEYGTRIASSMDIEFVALKPNIRDYIFKTNRRTQISYPKDISLIIMFSGIGPGSRVVEAGTGTGALTSAIAHYIKPAGRVYTYEVRQEFAKNAKKNLERAKLLEYVELKEGDVTEGIEEKDLDAVILDMATPWLVVPHAYTALKGSGVLVSFSPTIDQVVKAVEALTDYGFVGIETVETLMRFMQVVRGKTRPQTVMTGHTGYLTFARKAIKLEPDC
ncbi:methyltransferase domain-containing protein [archaeon]|nr:methyltransferase domain-containing protein [archaeon]TET27360.1 MAG: tRNA (adenine-N1)-methyltransferase [Candidatus Bathyarchaeum sp.]